MREKDLTQGGIPGQIWSLAWPMILSFFFQTLYNFVDAVWVGRLQEEAISAVSISQVSLFIMVSTGLGVTVGSGVLISMNIGMKNKPEAERVLGQAFVLAALLAGIFTAAGLIWRSEILRASGAGGTIFPLAMDYFTIIAAGSILIFQMIVIVFAFNAQGDNTTVTLLFLISTIINCVLDPLLIFGIPSLGFPGLGIRGAAIATLISQAVMVIIGIRILSGERMMIRFHWNNLVMKRESVKRVLNIGLPAAATQILNPLMFAILTQIIMRSFREPGTNGFAVGFRIENFAFLPAIGFGMAAMAMVGQNTGARNLERIRASRRSARIFAFSSGSAIGVLSILLAGPIIRLLGVEDPSSAESAMSYLLTVPFSYGIFAMLFVNVNALQATGKSWPGFFIYLTQTAVTAVGGVLVTSVFSAPLRSIWAVMIVGRIITFIVSEAALGRRFSALEREFARSADSAEPRESPGSPDRRKTVSGALGRRNTDDDSSKPPAA